MKLTLEHIRDFAHLRIEHAAKKLNIGLTNLKTQCRKLGVKRWPFRYYTGLQQLYWKAHTREQSLAIQKDLDKFLKDPRNMKLSRKTKEFRNFIHKKEFERRRELAKLCVEAEADGADSEAAAKADEPIDFEHIFDW